MNIPIKLLRRFATGQTVVAAGLVIATVSFVVAVIGLASQVDGDAVRQMIDNAEEQPLKVVVGLGGFGLAFLLRSFLWTRVLAALPLSQSWAAIHVALGANHILPFRLGEPLRVVSAVRRAGIEVGAAATSTVGLRAADIAGLLIIGVVLAPAAMVDLLVGQAGWAWTLGLATVGVLVLAWLFRLATSRGIEVQSHLPGPLLFALTGSAWLFEAVLVWQVAGLAGTELSYANAVLVTSIAVSAQLIAIAPGGLGTYEAAASAALMLTGVDARSAVSIAVVTHLLKTLYSLLTGAVAMFFPRPGLLGHLRVPSSITPAAFSAPSAGPVVLFMPAYQEGPRIADAIARAPDTSLGRRVIILVIDDGSTDDTVEQATSAGATVVSLPKNMGLGAAVAKGLKHSVAEFGAAVVVFCDADGEYDPAGIDDLVDPILSGEADYVIGSRFAGAIEHMRPHRRFGNLTLTRWVRWMTRTPVTDGQSGYRALSAQAASAVHMAHNYNYAQVLTIDLIQKGFRYAEVPITYHFRESGDSFVKLGTYLRTVVPTVWRLLNTRPAR